MAAENAKDADVSAAWQTDYLAFAKVFFGKDFKSLPKEDDPQIRQFLKSIANKNVRWKGAVSGYPIGLQSGNKEVVMGFSVGREAGFGTILLKDGSLSDGSPMKSIVDLIPRDTPTDVTFTFPGEKAIDKSVSCSVTADGLPLILIFSAEKVKLVPDM